MIQRLLSRLPGKQYTIKLFATAVFIVYGWTIYASFWKIPSWIFYLRLNEIISVYAYSFLLDFLESILLTLGFIFLGFLLTRNLWKDGFLAASVVILIVSVWSALIHMRIYEDPNLREHFIASQPRWWAVTLMTAFVASFVSVRVAWLRRSIEDLADRFVVFLYIYIPLTILSIAVVVVRIAL